MTLIAQAHQLNFTLETLVAIASAAISFVSMLIALYFAVRSSGYSHKAGRIAEGQLETSLRAQIQQTQNSMSSFAFELSRFVAGRTKSQLNAAEKRQLELFESSFKNALESNLNAYEDACTKYLGGRVDKADFKRMYNDEIRNLCRAKVDHPVFEHLNPPDSCRYQQIWKVYREWNHD